MVLELRNANAMAPIPAPEGEERIASRSLSAAKSRGRANENPRAVANLTFCQKGVAEGSESVDAGCVARCGGAVFCASEPRIRLQKARTGRPVSRGRIPIGPALTYAGHLSLQAGLLA